MTQPAPPPRRRGGLGWIWLLLGIALLVILIVLLLRACGDGDDDSSGARTTATTSAQAEPGGASGEDGEPAGDAGELTSGGEDLLAAARGRSLEAFEGRDVDAAGVSVQSVVNETGFWAGGSEDRRVFVEIEDEDGSPIDLQDGDRVSFTGAVEKNDEAETYGLRRQNGAAQFREQGYHVRVQAGDVELE